MIPEIIETQRLIFKPFSHLTPEEKQLVVKGWKNPFNARFNAINNPTQTVEEIALRPEPTFTITDDKSKQWFDSNYFRAVYDKFTQELIGVCRFGMFYTKQTQDVWDFGLFNVLMKHWGKGYGTVVLHDVCDIAKSVGVKYLYAEADNDNFGSYHAMIKSGLKLIEKEDGDIEYCRDLNMPMPTKEEINEEWLKHIAWYIQKFGQERFDRLNQINNLTKDMLKEIKESPEQEVYIVAKYYEMCNVIQEFPEKCEGE